MADKQAGPTGRAAELTLRLLRELFSGKSSLNVGIRLWDGTRWPDDQIRPATLVLNHPGALRTMFLPGTEVGRSGLPLTRADWYSSQS